MTEKIGITDLDVDSLSHIMLLVARSPDGATSFARALSVSKSFREMRNDPKILKSVRFEIRKYPESFWGINGLLTRCACAKNVQACKNVLEYLAARAKVLKQIRRLAAEAAVLKDETQDAHLAVGTRGRKRAADWANEKHKRLCMDVERESEELKEHIYKALDLK